MAAKQTMGPLMKQLILALLTATSLSACTSVERLRPDVEARTPPSRLEEIAYINVLREAFDDAPGARLPAGELSPECYGGDNTYFRGQLSQGYREHTREQEALPRSPNADPRPQCVTYRDGNPDDIRRYLQAGFGLSDLYCQRFFIVASQASLRRRFGRGIGTATDSLIGTILSLATAGETAIGIVNAGFGAIDSTFQNIDDSFMVAPDLENVRSLVHASQDSYRTETLGKNLPQSYAAARAVIERYAGICSYTGIRRLVNVSVGDQTGRLQAQTDQRRSGTTTTTGATTATTAPALQQRLPGSTPVPPSE